MATPGERLAELAGHAQRTIERIANEPVPPSTGCDLALSLAHAVLRQAEESTVAVTSADPFSFAIAAPPAEPPDPRSTPKE